MCGCNKDHQPPTGSNVPCTCNRNSVGNCRTSHTNKGFPLPLAVSESPPPLAEKVTSSRPPTHCVGSMLTLCCASVTLCWVVSKRWDPLSPTAHTAEMEANAPHADIQTKPVVSQNVRRVSIILVNYQLAKNTGSFVQPLIQCLYLM